jgi:hypothetical protein
MTFSASPMSPSDDRRRGGELVRVLTYEAEVLMALETRRRAGEFTPSGYQEHVDVLKADPDSWESEASI